MASTDRPWVSFKERGEGTAAAILRDWFRSLEEDRGERAALRRSDDPAACAFRPAFHRLRRRLSALGKVNDDALAVVAVLVAGVRKDAYGAPFPRRLWGGNKDKPVLSELRLQRLLQEGAAEDVLRQLRRALAMVGNEADVADLAHWAYRLAQPALRDRAARDFAYAYYGAVGPMDGEPADTSTTSDAA